MKKIKVLFITEGLSFGGIQRTISYLSSYLSEKNHGDDYDVSIALFEDNAAYVVSERVKVIKGGIGVRHELVMRIVNSLRRVVFINRVVKKGKYDLVISMNMGFAKYLPLSLHHRYKLIVSERGNPRFESSKEKKRRKRIVSFADGIIFQTERAKAAYPDAPASKCTVIPNAVGNPMAYKLQWVPSEKKICAIGRLHYQKDYITMIKAFKIFLKKHHGYKLVIYGEGEEKDNIDSIIKEEDLELSVIIEPPCEDALKRISNGELYVLSSITEGMPNTLMEAMAIGMPCVSTDCEFGPGELIVDGENGLLVPVGDVYLFADAMKRMIEDECLAKRCALNASKIIKTNDIDSVCKKYESFFLEVIYNK